MARHACYPDFGGMTVQVRCFKSLTFPPLTSDSDCSGLPIAAQGQPDLSSGPLMSQKLQATGPVSAVCHLLEGISQRARLPLKSVPEARSLSPYPSGSSRCRGPFLLRQALCWLWMLSPCSLLFIAPWPFRFTELHSPGQQMLKI